MWAGAALYILGCTIAHVDTCSTVSMIIAHRSMVTRVVLLESFIAHESTLARVFLYSFWIHVSTLTGAVLHIIFLYMDPR